METKIADFIVGRYVNAPTTGNGTFSGIFRGFGERLGQYAPVGAVDILIEGDDGKVRTLRSSRLYTGHMATPNVTVGSAYSVCQTCGNAGRTETFLTEHTCNAFNPYDDNGEPMHDADDCKCDDCDTKPVLRAFEVQVPIKGEVIFTVHAYSAEEALTVSQREDWGNGELNVEQDNDLEVNTVDLGEA